MSVLIKGMEMPKSCFYCPFRRKINPDDIQCLVTRDVFEETFAGTIESRNRGNCPLIELPPHGRLIDADKITLTDIDLALCEDYKSLLSLYINKVESAQTIIEAEVSE